MKPRLFIGSSAEGLKFAQAIQAELRHVTEAERWNQNTFILGGNVLDDLLRKLGECDYGIFVFSPDDVLTMREQQLWSARDNVIFEFGLYLGRLGRNESFFVTPHNLPGFHIPTDLIGVNPATYDPAAIPRDEKGKIRPTVTVADLQVVLSDACIKIQDAITRNPKAQLLFDKLTRRLVYLLRHMQRDAQIRVATHFWKVIATYKEINENNVKGEWSLEEQAGWETASEFACFHLSALGLVEDMKPSGYRISEFGKRILASNEAQERFKPAFDELLIDDKDL